jgi:steroid 5-alpha reductase family enzyme
MRLLLVGLAVSLAGFTALWLASLARRDASLVDRFWGLAFVVLAGYWSGLGEAPPARRGLVLALVSLWGLRLSLHLTRRNWGRGEDYRYREMRAKWGARFPWMSLVTVHWLQAAIAWLVAWPLWAALALPGPRDLGGLDFAGALLWLVGFLFEAIGDEQLARFKRDPSNRGRVCDRGLWRYTRHPNYFGDACLWWGFGLIGLAAGPWWILAGPLAMTFLLLKVSGVALLEKRLGETRPEYRDYIERTNAFVPGPSRRSAAR